MKLLEAERPQWYRYEERRRKMLERIWASVKVGEEAIRSASPEHRVSRSAARY
jgi:hypothetical protein